MSFPCWWTQPLSRSALFLAFLLGMLAPGLTGNSAEEEGDAQLGAERAAIVSKPPVGTLRGQFTVIGGPRGAKDLVISKVRRDLRDEELLDSSLEHYAKLGLKDESFLISPEGGLKNVIVWISDKKIPIPPEPAVRRLPAPAMLEFKDGLLRPRVLAFESWRVLRFSNADPYALNFRWEPLQGDRFNQVLERDKTVDVRAQAQRLPTKVQSDMYPWVKAWLFPVKHPYFAVTKADGSFQMDRIPEGEWEFSAWHESFGYVQSSAWPRGQFMRKIEAGENKLEPVEIKLPGVKKEESQPPEDLAAERKSRLKKNERENASEFTGLWRMTLPAGYQYDVKISQDKERGTLALDCEQRALVLLGEFAMREGELRLVDPLNDKSVRDLIWTYRDGNFVLTKEMHGTGANYVGAVLERQK